MNATRPTICLRPVFLVMALGTFTLFLGCPVLLAVVALVKAPLDVSIPIAIGVAMFVPVLGWAMSSSFQWVELDDGVIRVRRLLTGRMFEKPVADIVRVSPLHSAVMGEMDNAILDSMMKTSNRGYLLRFHDGSNIGLVRGDMAGLDEFLKVLAVEIASRCGPLEAP